MKREGEVEKNYVIYTLEIGFTLLNRKNNLMISALTGWAAEDKVESIMYIVLSINACKAKSLCMNVRRRWTYQSLLIINEQSMISLKLLAKIDK